MTLAEVEAALAAGRLEIATASGAWWKLRRNGKTQTWVTRPDHWSIPVKYGLKYCARMNQDWELDWHFRVKPE